MKRILAIDPGASGGMAYTDDDNSQAASFPMPDTEGDVLDKLREIAALGIQVCYIEEVGGYCGAAMPGSAMFKFGRGFGFTLGCLMALGFRVEMVKPQKWQKHFSLGTVKSNGGKVPWKNRLKSEAQRRFPTSHVTLATADALLILDYAKAQP